MDYVINILGFIVCLLAACINFPLIIKKRGFYQINIVAFTICIGIGIGILAMPFWAKYL